VTADELCAWLSGPASQRDKLVAIRTQHVQTISALSDADHKRVFRELKQRLSSPRLADEVAQLIVTLARESTPELPPVEVAQLPQAPSPRRGDDDAAHFEALIAADPDDRDNYLVYGDWLSERGRPLGALITIGAELVKHPTHAKMLVAHDQHLVRHPELRRGLEGCMDMLTNVEWAYGFIKRCRVATTADRFNRGLREGQVHALVSDVLRFLLDDPGTGRFLQDLTLGMVNFDGGNFYELAIAALAAKPRPALRTLSIGDFSRDESELNWASLGDMTALWPQLPGLRELTLRAGSMKLGPISLAKLERFTTITGGLDAESVEHVARAAWPALRMLSLQIGLAHQGGAIDVRCLEPLLTGSTPQLTCFGILNCGFTEELVERLVASPLLDQLSALDLSMGTLGDDGVAMLCAHAARLRRITINVDDNYVTPAGCDRMRATFPTAIIGEQRGDRGNPEVRHASAYE